MRAISLPGVEKAILSDTVGFIRDLPHGLVEAFQATLQEASAADAVIVGSGLQTREVVADAALMAQLQLDPARQLQWLIDTPARLDQYAAIARAAERARLATPRPASARE